MTADYRRATWSGTVSHKDGLAGSKPVPATRFTLHGSDINSCGAVRNERCWTAKFKFSNLISETKLEGWSLPNVANGGMMEWQTCNTQNVVSKDMGVQVPLPLPDFLSTNGGKGWEYVSVLLYAGLVNRYNTTLPTLSGGFDSRIPHHLISWNQ